MRWTSRVGSLFGAGAGVGASALAWSLLEAHLFTQRWVTVPASVPGTPPLRILHLSDLHLLPGQRRKHAFIRSCLNAGPDMVVVTGDILGHRDVVDDAVDLLGPLACAGPCLFSLGSNDIFAPVLKSPLHYFWPSKPPTASERLDTNGLVAGLRRHGWICVENTRLRLPTPAGPVDVLGLGDAHVRRDQPQALREAGSHPSDDADLVLRLGITHAPYLRVLDAFETCGVDLTLAGHTHGGQVRVPGVGALVDNCDLPLRQARGVSAHTRSMWLHVSAGLGTSRYTPIRFACRPEATVVDVVARPAPAH